MPTLATTMMTTREPQGPPVAREEAVQCCFMRPPMADAWRYVQEKDFLPDRFERMKKIIKK